MRLMKMRHRRAWARRLRILVLPACALALAVPAGAHAAPSQDLRSPDARDAARAAQAQSELGPARSMRVIESSGDQTLPLALSSAAIGIALAGLAVALGAMLRRPRSRWSVN
jgi:hypothetical protein